MDGGPEAPVLLGASYRVVSLDGHDLNQPPVLGPEQLPLGMGQRADLVFIMPVTGAVRPNEHPEINKPEPAPVTLKGDVADETERNRVRAEYQAQAERERQAAIQAYEAKNKDKKPE